MSIIEINDLHFSYTSDYEVLKGIGLQFDRQTTAIVGQNGAGKSTFVKLLKGLLNPTKGEIFVHGNNIEGSTAAELAKQIGLVFQNPNDQIFKNTVLSEVMFGPLNIGQKYDIAKENAIQALKKVNLERYLEANPYDLSLSERKMISIASILAMETGIVILDEPTMGQDFSGKEKLKEIIYNLRDQGKLVICILHDMDFTAEVFERTIVLNEGKVLKDGPTEETFTEEEILLQAHLEQPYISQIATELGLEGTYLTDDKLIDALKGKMSKSEKYYIK